MARRAWIGSVAMALVTVGAVWGINAAYRGALWSAFLRRAAVASYYFADQAALALSFQDEVALGWAVRRAVMGDVLYAQVVVGDEVRYQDAVADLTGLELGVDPPKGEVELARVRLPRWGMCVDVRRRIHGRGPAASEILGYVRMGFSTRDALAPSRTFLWASSLGGASLWAVVTAFLLFSTLRERGAPASPGARSGAVVIDDERKEVIVRGKRVALSPKEYELLRLLASSPGKVFSAREILERVWPNDAISAEEVKRYIYLLRRKIEEDPAAPRHIVTVKGFGYRFEP